ncbi:GNAT family N-acetyltransferase [Gracilimonas sp. BCB1]|uniref:GNAT family N-acetyltransferase n=1 Tax=Gracilimonas sp. BCB1 TaxID=3152362 RepID=UPI0032D8E078
MIPSLQTKRLILRPFTEDDLDNVFKGLSNPDIIKYYGISFETRESAKEQMKWFADHERNETGAWWAICLKDSGHFIGAGGLNDIEHDHKKAEFGFWLLPEYWGNGFMGEAIPAILNHGFEKINLHRIEGFVESKNTNCQKALDKLNFTFEGTMRNAEIKNGRYIDIDIYSKLSTD